MITSILVFIIAFLSLIALMIIHELGHFLIAKRFGVKVDEFGIGYPPRIFGKKIGETIYSVNWVMLGAFVRIRGEEGGIDDLRSFSNLKIWQRVLIVIGGVAAFWVTAIVIFSIVFAVGTQLPIGDQDVKGVVNPQVKVVSVASNSPAFEAGLNVGDVLLSVSNKEVTQQIDKIKDFQVFTQDHAGKEIILTIQRNNQEIDVLLSPRENPPAGQGAVGVGLERMATLIERYSWYQAPLQGIAYTWKVTVSSLQGLWSLITGLFQGKGAPQGSEFAGPLGITVFLANAASYGVGFFLYFIGVICVLIAIFNLFPIPALDGGKLVFLILEKIKGKPVSPKIEQVITLVFFAILIILSIFITIKFDIPRFTDFLKSSLSK